MCIRTPSLLNVFSKCFIRVSETDFSPATKFPSNILHKSTNLLCVRNIFYSIDLLSKTSFQNLLASIKNKLKTPI